MMSSPWSSVPLSRLMLGTVQFGMPYGVANCTGQPAYRDVLEILAAAVDGGVNCLDTASAYGTSEDVLGRALHELGVSDRVVVVTKVHPLTPAELADAALAADRIEQSVAASRRRLSMDCLPLVLFHREADAVYWEVLERLKDRGWLRHYGVSCGHQPGPAAEYVAGGRMSALQLPGNLLDQRHLRSGILREASSRGVAVFMRSVYLQGLLVMPEDRIPPELRGILSVRRGLTHLARDAGLGLAELGLRFLLSQEGVTSVLVGVETLAQMRDNLAMFARGPLDRDLLAAVNVAVPELAELLITPGMWPARAV